MTCLITGCDLEMNGKHIHGDLHVIGNVYVFNSFGCEWVYTPAPSSGKIVKILDTRGMYEAHGTIVIPTDHCILNKNASEYIGR